MVQKPRIRSVLLIGLIGFGLPWMLSLAGTSPSTTDHSPPARRDSDALATHHLPDGATYRVPYRLSETLHMIVRAKFNGKGPFNFIVDTGAPALFVTTDVAEQVGVKPGRDGWATFDRMEIEGGATLDRVKARVENIFQIRGMNALSLPGVKLNGVLGYTILARFRMEFDLSKSVMTWTRLDFEPPQPRPLGVGGGAGGGSSARPELEAMGGIVQMFGSLFGRDQPEAVVTRGFLGIELVDVDDGVRIKSVLPNSPADEAGLKPGDMLVEFAVKSVSSASEVLKIAATIGADEQVRLVVSRDDEKVQLTAKTGKGF